MKILHTEHYVNVLHLPLACKVHLELDFMRCRICIRPVSAKQIIIDINKCLFKTSLKSEEGSFSFPLYKTSLMNYFLFFILTKLSDVTLKRTASLRLSIVTIIKNSFRTVF